MCRILAPFHDCLSSSLPNDLTSPMRRTEGGVGTRQQQARPSCSGVPPISTGSPASCIHMVSQGRTGALESVSFQPGLQADRPVLSAALADGKALEHVQPLIELLQNRATEEPRDG